MSIAEFVPAPRIAGNDGGPRHDWTRAEIGELFALPFPDLIFRAQTVHRENFDPSEVQVSTLLSIKTGGCPEDCAYCPQSAKYDTGVKAEKLMSLDKVLAEAQAAKDAGASRFCMGAAWREPKDRDLDKVCAMIEGVRAMGLETCVTLGMLTECAGEAAEAVRPRLLQPQSRHLAGILRRDHHDPHLSGAARHARSCARRRHPCLLRRHRRHGRGCRRSRRHDPCAGDAAGASGKRADQPAGAGRRHAAFAMAQHSIRSSSCAPSRSRASRCRARWCGCRPAART